MTLKLEKRTEKYKLLNSGELRVHIIYGLDGRATLRDEVTLGKKLLKDNSDKEITKLLQEVIETWMLQIKVQVEDLNNAKV